MQSRTILNVSKFLVAATITALTIHASAMSFADDEGMVPTVKVMVAGQPVDFLFDTGSNSTTLGSNATKSKLKTKGLSVSYGATGTSNQCAIVHLPKLSIDNIHVSKFDVSQCAGGDNLLGLDLLDQRVFVLNYRASLITFLTGSPGGLTNLLTRTQGGRLAVQATIGTLQGPALFDTGWSITTFDLVFVQKHPELFTATGESVSSVDATGQTTVSNLYRVGELKVGDLDFTNVVIMAMDLAPMRRVMNEPTIGMVIGEDLMHKGTWVFDLAANLWRARLY